MQAGQLFKPFRIGFPDAGEQLPDQGFEPAECVPVRRFRHDAGELLQPVRIKRQLLAAGFTVEDVDARQDIKLEMQTQQTDAGLEIIRELHPGRNEIRMAGPQLVFLVRGMVDHAAAAFEHQEAAVERKRVFSLPDETRVGKFQQPQFQERMIIPQKGIAELVLIIIYCTHFCFPCFTRYRIPRTI